MSEIGVCPSCSSEVTYFDGSFNACGECGHLWSETEEKQEEEEVKILDSNGNELKDGDTVYVIKELKIKGSSKAIKKGTKVNNITLVHNPTDGHDISCRIDGFGSMKLKSEFVKK